MDILEKQKTIHLSVLGSLQNYLNSNFFCYFLFLIVFSFRIVKRRGFTISYNVPVSRRGNPHDASINEIQSSGYEELREEGENQTYETIL